jgi:hypothetical protein
VIAALGAYIQGVAPVLLEYMGVAGIAFDPNVVFDRLGLLFTGFWLYKPRQRLLPYLSIGKKRLNRPWGIKMAWNIKYITTPSHVNNN